MDSLGQKIKKLRKEKGLTQQDLVDNTISRSMLSLIENNATHPSMSTLTYLAHKLGKPLSYFLSNDDEIRQEGEKLLSEAETLIDSKEYITAINKIEVFLAQYQDTVAHASMDHLFGSLYTLLGISSFHIESANAIDHLSIAVKRLSNTGSPIYLSKAYNCLSLLKYRDNDYKAMEELLIRADSILGNTTLNNIRMKLNITYNLTLAYYMQHKYEETLELVNQTLSYCSKYEVFFNFGEFNMVAALACKNLNKLEQAIECNLKAIHYYELSQNVLMRHRIYLNLSALYRIIGDSYNAICYINKAIDYFKSEENMLRYTNAIVEKIITMFVFHSDATLIKDLISVTINHPQLGEVQKGELLSILGTIELQNNNYNQALELLLSAQNLVNDYINSSTNIFIYRGLYEIYEYKQDHANSILYKSKLDTLLEEKPYYR